MAANGGNVTYDEAFLNENRQNEVYATHIAFFVLMMIIVPCRFLSSRLTKKTLSWDDWFAYFAAVCRTNLTEINVSDIPYSSIRLGCSSQVCYGFDLA
jgi:hypothetical protein